jgi:hypothetical protein
MPLVREVTGTAALGGNDPPPRTTIHFAAASVAASGAGVLYSSDRSSGLAGTP